MKTVTENGGIDHMASSPDFVTYAVAQLAGAGEITCRKMFGEYGIYCDGKFCAVICDNSLC